MSKNTIETEKSDIGALPTIVYGKGIDPGVHVDPVAAAETMRELGVTEEGIASSAVYVDPKNRLANYGTHYTNTIGRMRFAAVPELRGVEGDIVRLSTKVRGKNRTPEQINRIAVHEWEHLAQHDRHDINVTEGHVAIYGLAALGAFVGSKLGKGGKNKVGAVLGGMLGYQIGYRLAPHERQARLRAGQVRGFVPQVESRAVSIEPKPHTSNKKP